MDAVEVDPNLTPEVVDYGWEQSSEIGDVMDAFAKAQAKFTDPVKDTPGQYGKHASMAGVYAAVRKHLNSEGIAIIVAKSAQHDVALVGVSVRLYKGPQFFGVHASTPIKADRQSYIWAQASGWTYLERYLTSGLTGVAPDEDDDGAGAAKDGNPDQSEVQQRTAQKKAEKRNDAPDAAVADDKQKRSSFFAKAKELNWGLDALKTLLKKKYGHFDTSKLTGAQIDEALVIMGKGDPDEVLANLDEPAAA
jgi:hypothetical protein